jgi:hypothetical protein
MKREAKLQLQARLAAALHAGGVDAATAATLDEEDEGGVSIILAWEDVQTLIDALERYVE